MNNQEEILEMGLSFYTINNIDIKIVQIFDILEGSAVTSPLPLIKEEMEGMRDYCLDT